VFVFVSFSAGAFEKTKEAHKVVAWFWRAIAELEEEEKAKLLQFATGTDRVPVAGFAALQSSDGKLCPFGLEAVKLKKGKDRQFPRAHTCFNRIDLPLYTSYDDTLVNLRVALNEGCVGFGFK
jgi:hypothetical protein